MIMSIACDRIASLYNTVISILNMPSSDTDSGRGNFNPALIHDVANRDTSALIVPVYEYTKACSSFNTCVKEYSFPSLFT